MRAFATRQSTAAKRHRESFATWTIGQHDNLAIQRDRV